MSEPPIEFPITAQDRFSRVFAQLKRDLSDTRDLTRGIGAAVSGAAVPLLAVGTAAAAAFAAVKRVADGLDNLNDAADATGSAINRFAALDRLARQNNESTELVTNSLLKLNKTLSDAKGDSPLARQLQAIGLDLQQLRDQDPADALQAVARALAGYADNGDRARVVQQIFGKSTREVAGFLKDLAAASDLGTEAIARQAAEAERFNKNLAQLQVELTDVGRTIAGPVVSGLNTMFARMRAAQETYGGFWSAFKADFERADFREPADGVAYFAREIRQLEADIARLRKGGSVFDNLNADGKAKDLEKSIKNLEYYRRLLSQTLEQEQSDPRNDARRGRGFVGLPTIPVVEEPTKTDPTGARKVSEAERYLENLRNQAEQLLELTSTERVLRDIQLGRLEGLNPRLEAEIRSTAQRIDLQRQLNAEVKREADLQSLLAGKAQGDINSALGRLDSTPTGQAERRAADVQRLLELSRRLPETDPQQQKILEALQQIKRESEQAAKGLEDLGKTGKTEFEKLQEAVDGFANNSIEALLDFSETGEFSFSRLFKAFRRDLLKALIEEPVRNSMKNVVDIIRKELGNLDGANNPLAKLFELIKGIGSSSSGGGLGSLFEGIGNFFGGRSMGGDTREGRMYRWRENGAEYFVPQENGTVITQADLRRMGGATVDARTTIVVQGGVNADVLATLERRLAERDARLIRSLQYGRLKSA